MRYAGKKICEPGGGNFDVDQRKLLNALPAVLITRLDPFSDELLDDLLRGYFPRPVRAEAPAYKKIRLEVTEDRIAYTVCADIPGVRKEDINITIDGNRVAISAELKRAEEKGAKTLHCDRYFGHMGREFTLPQEIDQAEAAARYDNGVLALRLPKKAASVARQLRIQ
jgi:HSP20 family protein